MPSIKQHEGRKSVLQERTGSRCSETEAEAACRRWKRANTKTRIKITWARCLSVAMIGKNKEVTRVI